MNIRNRTFFVEKDLGSGTKFGLGRDDGIDRKLFEDFLGVSSPILTCQK